MGVRKRWKTDRLIVAFEKYLRSTLGAAEKTCALYSGYASSFARRIQRLAVFEVGRLCPKVVIRYVADQARHYRPKTVQLIASALRSFFRFLQFKGLADSRLVDAVPTVPNWRLSSLPPALSEEQLGHLLSSFDRSRTRASGIRGYAITMCMATLGLRADDVSHLCLEHIDWRCGILRLPAGKARRADVLPLPQEVAAAIAQYLRLARPKTQDRHVFVRHMRPRGGPLTNSAVRRIVHHAFRRARIDSPSWGSHILRHTMATRMIRGGASLKEVADVLRHRCIDTTAIYAKVDFPTLAAVALPWPEVCK